MACLRAAGQSVRKIAASVDRSPSTVARELKRNGSRTQGYQPVYANQQAHARRWRGSRLERNSALRDQILARLKQGWSPEQVAGRLALETGKRVISHETIYRFIYAQLARKKDYTWRQYLPLGKSKRGRRSRRRGNPASFFALRRPLAERPQEANDRRQYLPLGKSKRGRRSRRRGNPASFFALRRPLAERPQEANDRQTPGHWEADLMLFRTYGQAVLTLHERHSRLIIALRPPGKASDPIAEAMTTYWLLYLQSGVRRSPSITALSSQGITNSMPSAYRPSSAIPTRPGRREA